ncbi:hypothetical protein OF829_17610 [Sphingomonas sp. LB-2]|uniref:hypothetical protein n=1 Tax=Sphingomonas caeni TaxID=2984949 RepID=UPI00222FBB0E|nr:hypothetical protein [Sphingomonas caeni]MCW3849059.1 hypothetical protein [Sphingomonas caeni]
MTISRCSALLAALLVAGCGSPLKAGDAVAIADANASDVAGSDAGMRPAIADAELLARAFQAVYGHRTAFEQGNGSGKWVTAPETLFHNGKHRVLIASDQPLYQRGKMLRVSYLDSDGDGKPYRVRKTWELGPRFVYDWNVSGFFGPPTLYVAEASMGAGSSCGTFWLIELRDEGPVTVAEGPLSYGVYYKEPHAQVGGEIVGIEQGRSFRVKYTGAENLTETWLREGDHYVRSSRQRLSDVCDWEGDGVKQ